MSLSPDEVAEVSKTPYQFGWLAVHRLMREGKSWSGNERHCAFLGLGDGRFGDVSSVSGLGLPEDGRSAVVCDWNGDGAQDVWLLSRTSPRLRLFLGTKPEGTWSRSLRLIGKGGNRDAIGARAVATIRVSEDETRTLTRTVRAGDGYLAQGSRWLHFAGEEPAVLESLEVFWPDGSRQEIAFRADLETTHFDLAQGDTLSPAAIRGGTLVPVSASVLPEPPSTEKARIPLAARLPMPPLLAKSPGGVPTDLLQEHLGRPFVLLAWAPWCAPCVAELREFAGAADKLRQAGVHVVALNLDDSEEGKRDANRLYGELRWPFSVAQGDEDLANVLDLVQQHVLERRRRLALPTAFLIDGRGRLYTIYKGGLTPSRLALDSVNLSDAPAQQRNAAMPFRGRWRKPPIEADVLGLEARLRKAGLDEVARAYYAGHMQRTMEREVSPAEMHLQLGLARMRQRNVELATKHLRAAVEQDPTLHEAWSNLAILLHRQGNLPEAIEAYETALKLKPDDVYSRFNLGQACADTDDMDRARKVAAKLSEFDPALGARLLEGLELREQKAREAEESEKD